MHNPNPFDFVPFAAQPLLKTEAEFNSMGDLYSGYLELRIKALTPVHIVGYQEPDGNGRKSHMYRQNAEVCIPAASIRGCLRSFIEAITAGWVSQATTEYPKEYMKRHVGYATFDWYKSKGRRNEYHMESAVNGAYKPKTSTAGNSLLDVASYLFGIVIEKEGESAAKHEELGRKSRIWVEDAFIRVDQMDPNRYWIPDITGEAFMGGAKPSASNWWYMQPREIWQRNVNFRGQIMPVAEFIGEKYWGRKFYYHQNPEKCVQYYEPQNHNWMYRDTNPFCRVRLESLKPTGETETFRIYVNRVPLKLLMLLVFCVSPGKNIRHKLGHGKAYGFGSVEFSIEKAMLRTDSNDQRIPSALNDNLADIPSWSEIAWQQERMKESGFDISLIDWRALEKITQVLSWEYSDKLIYTYPPFKTGYFARGIGKQDFNNTVQPDFRLETPIKTTPDVARRIASKLFEIKKPIHFQLYQERSNGWEIIRKRKP